MDKIHTMMTDTIMKYNHNCGELEKIQQKFDELVKETNQFTYIITHDLQAPLRMVTGFLELLEKRYADKIDASGKQYIEYAVKGSSKMKELLFDLLEYSRLSSVQYEFCEVDLNSIIDDIKEKFAAVITAKNVVIRKVNLPVVWGNNKLLTQLISELIDNAIKFNHNTPCEILIEANSTSSGWQVSVSDNGIGIEAAHFEKIFVVFRKLHPEDAGYAGTGIGLAICKKIAELHNGGIHVLSVPGTGSKFSFTISDKTI